MMANFILRRSTVFQVNMEITYEKLMLKTVPAKWISKGPCNTEKYCWSPWLASRESF